MSATVTAAPFAAEAARCRAAQRGWARLPVRRRLRPVPDVTRICRRSDTRPHTHRRCAHRRLRGRHEPRRLEDRVSTDFLRSD